MELRTKDFVTSVVIIVLLYFGNSHFVQAGGVEDAFISYAESHNEFIRQYRTLDKKSSSNATFLRDNIIAPAKNSLDQAIKEQQKKSIDKRLSKFGIVRVEKSSEEIRKVYNARKELMSELSALRNPSGKIETKKDDSKKGNLKEVSITQEGLELDGKDNPRLIEFKKRKKKKLTPKEQELLEMGIHPK